MENPTTSDSILQLSVSDKGFLLDTEEWNFFDDTQDSHFDLDSFRKKQDIGEFYSNDLNCASLHPNNTEMFSTNKRYDTV